MLDWQSIATHVVELGLTGIAAVVGAGLSWAANSLRRAHRRSAKLTSDLNAAFVKIRQLETRVSAIDDDGPQNRSSQA